MYNQLKYFTFSFKESPKNAVPRNLSSPNQLADKPIEPYLADQFTNVAVFSLTDGSLEKPFALRRSFCMI